MISYKERLSPITTFVFDVDGVLTTGEVLLVNGTVIRTLNSKDGYAIQYAVKKGYRVLMITGGNSQDVKDRLEGLGAHKVMLRSADKLVVYEQLKQEFDFSDNEVLYMGDDIPDIPVMRLVGVSTCPQDAAVEVKAICHYQSPLNGGRACVRDVIEQVMRLHGKWMNDDAYHW
ncbi:MAG: 3-deoxy-D-manno-octulosonate 8-phosphate phosphatase [Candidatus Fluviicola riflensis]|nr:MAG: 3-deoxy-D-manno-octulosonate 8-phosphate phosphatase [Candidatus Fluviicola riflensis]OGS76048.1 MAG: 3-deoxy-D-manno-octulosonate 8-phosphate phosphatase [Candidatus Fluviicola riflensis]OGS81948.1 MAG: 3-deoxy-D-manno-octulosonate 8-phosphate phosphatase [Fluviicola sp. RIFCSPHIGHO2_01_FULL_43_53]OGS83386.1 MAG: 3-deoxy-D-manno-octulosonate 8-phosphate phosphatase [Fluviicola sp. RIFCSPHIGHO2_12_FULL_43_24]